MTVAGNETSTLIKRCAVCKIDLKGRFVFVDERVEEILGQTMEQLFGKPIVAFLDPEGQRVVKDLLRKHNRYETSFDSCQVNLIGENHILIRANLIFSLCFAAGNPVNYQIVIDSFLSNTDHPGSTAEAGAMNLLQALSEISSPRKITNLIPALTQFIGEPRIAIYQFEDDDLIDLQSKAIVPASIDKVTNLHLELARSGGNYCFDDQVAVRKAVELTGQAPAEFIRAFKTSDSCYLFRVILDEKLSNKESAAQLELVRLAANLIGQWLDNPDIGNPPALSTDSGADMVAAGLHAADLLGAAAMTMNQAGEMTQHNATADHLFRTELNQCTYRELFIDQMKPVIKDDLPRLNLFVEQAFKTLNLPRYEMAVLLPDARVASLSIMRSDPSDPQSDLLMMVMPIPEVADAQTTRRTFAMAQSSFDDLQSLGRIASDYASRLSHEYFSHLDGDGNFVLMCLSSCLDKMLASVSGYKEMFQLGTRIKRISPTDLNVLMNELASSLGELARNIRINISHSDLPKIQTEAQVLKTILRILLAEVLCEWNEEDFNISVKCSMQRTQSILKIKLPSNCPQSAIDGLFRLTQTHSGPVRSHDTNPNPLGLAVDHLLRSLNASVDIDDKLPQISIAIGQPSAVDTPA